MRLIAFVVVALCVAAAVAKPHHAAKFSKAKHAAPAPHAKAQAPAKSMGPKVAKVLADVHAMEGEVKSLHNSEITSNLAAIKTDAMKLKTATPAKAHNLEEALKDRVKALKMQLEENESDGEEAVVDNDSEGEEAAVDNESDGVEAAVDNELEEQSAELEEQSAELEEQSAELEEDNELDNEDDIEDAVAEKKAAQAKKVAKVTQDVSKIRAEIKKSTYSAAARKEVLGNLDKIVADATSYSKTHNAKIKQALDLRMEALEEEMNPVKATSKKVAAKPVKAEKKVSAAKADKVAKDVAEVRAHLSESHLTKKAKKEVLSNLSSIEKDAKALKSAKGKHSADLSKAINLRTQALKVYN